MIGKRRKEVKGAILTEFSTKSWNELPPSEKKKHSLLNCDGCMKNDKYKALLIAFPVNKQTRNHCSAKQKLLPATKQIKDKTREIYNNANAVFQESFPGMEFNDAAVLLPELNIIKTPSWREKQKENRTTANKFRQSVEKHYKETAVARLFGTEMSMSKRKKIRLIQSFESPAQCKERSKLDVEKIST